MSPSLIVVALDVLDPAAGCLDHADRDVPGNDRERDVELSVMQMDVGAADLGVERPKQAPRPAPERRRKRRDPKRLLRTGHDDGLVVESCQSYAAPNAAEARLRIYCSVRGVDMFVGYGVDHKSRSLAWLGMTARSRRQHSRSSPRNCNVVVRAFRPTPPARFGHATTPSPHSCR